MRRPRERTARRTALLSRETSRKREKRMCQGRRAITRCLLERCVYIYIHIYSYIYIYMYIDISRKREAYVPRQVCHYSLPVGKVCVYICIKIDRQIDRYR